MKYILAILIAVSILLILNKKSPTERYELSPTDKIIAFGDSLTYGYGVDAIHSYPSVLSQLSGHIVQNEGLSGEISALGVKRLSRVLMGSDAKLMILCHGGNDILQRRSYRELKKNLKSMVDMAKSRGMQVLLIGVPDISLVGLSTPELYQEVAKEEEILYIDDLLEDILSDSSLKGDRIHPNAIGYKKMAEGIYRFLMHDL
jgi:lysophospholipase L1-like esterase